MNKKNILLETSRLAKGTFMALTLAVMLAAGFLVLAPARPAQAQEALGRPYDANCMGEIEANLSATDQRVAQTFTAQNGGKLTNAQVQVFKGKPVGGDYVLAIHAVDASGVPTNTVLASTTIPESTVPIGSSTIIGNFTNPASVEAGRQYALVVKRLDSGNLDLGARNGDACVGKPYLSSSETGPFSEYSTGNDLVFATYVTPVALANDDAYKVKEDKTLFVRAPGVLGNDTDSGGGALTLSLLSGPGKGRLTFAADGSFAYKPKRNFHGTDYFFYEVKNGSGSTDKAMVTVKVVKARR